MYNLVENNVGQQTFVRNFRSVVRERDASWTYHRKIKKYASKIHLE